MGKLTVRLYELVGTALVVSSPTGIWYSNQTMGTSCLQPEYEGILVPVGNDVSIPDWKLMSPEIALTEYFEGPVHSGTGASQGLTEADADHVDAVLARWNQLAGVRVDRAALRTSHEAWVHVLLSSECQIIEGWTQFPAHAVLTWANSD